MPKTYILVNCYNEPLSDHQPMTKAEAEAAVKEEWKKGWEVYIREETK